MSLPAFAVSCSADVLRWPGAPPMLVLRDLDGNRLVVVEGA
jgi:hypothetical protein